MYGLLHQTGVNAAWKNMIGAKFSHIPKDQQPRYGWDPKTTGRKQGFLENETAGNLQDLLEFFDPTRDDPDEIVRLAFGMAQLTPANQAPGRSSMDSPEKPPQPPPPPKREKSSKRSHSGTQKDLAPLPQPPVKERPITQWPGSIPVAGVRELPGSRPNNNRAEVNVPMPDYDATAVPQPLFASSLSPPPQRTQFAHAPGPSISISPASDPPPYVTPTTPFPLPRDTVVDLLNDYMAQDQLQAGNSVDMVDMPPPFVQYDDWTSICSTMVDDVTSPRGPPLPLAPHENPQLHPIRGPNVWAASGGQIESMYVDNVQACDMTCAGLQDAPPLPMQENNVRRPDVWGSDGPADYEGLDYDQEIAPPPPHVSWL